MHANVKDAYSVGPPPALGKADHNRFLLQPHYRPRVRSLPTATHSFRKWAPEAEYALRDCFGTSDWDILHSENIEEVSALLNTLASAWTLVFQ